MDTIATFRFFLPLARLFALQIFCFLFASPSLAAPPASKPSQPFTTSRPTSAKVVVPSNTPATEIDPATSQPTSSPKHGKNQFKHGQWTPELPPGIRLRPKHAKPQPYPTLPTQRPIRLKEGKLRGRYDAYGRYLHEVYESDDRLLRRYKIELVTVGPGHWLFTYFGHNALRVHDRLFGRDLTYNFGTFSGKNPRKLLNDYLKNQMKYWLSIVPHRWLLRSYQYNDRTYRVRTLQLRAKEIRRIVRFLRHHARSENRHYKYDHYRQNCSTKIRDTLHYAIGPVFREDALSISKETYRSHVMRKMTPNPLLMLLMDFGMGPFADKRIRHWDDFFLPDQLEAYLSSPKWSRMRGKPLVSAPKTLYSRKTAPPLRLEPVSLTYGIGIFWFLLGLLLWARPSFRRWLRLYLFCAASMGTALGFLMFFTWLPTPPQNANVLMYHPLHWLPFLLLSKKRWELPSTRSVLRLYLIAHAWMGLIYLTLKPLHRVPLQLNTHHYVVAILLFGLAAFRLYYGPKTDIPEGSGASK